MPDPVAKDINVWQQTPASSPAGTFVWEVDFVTVSSNGTVHPPDRRVFGAPTAGLTQQQVWAQLRAIAVANDAADLAPSPAPVKQFPGVYDATVANAASARITDPLDPRLPPGVVP